MARTTLDTWDANFLHKSPMFQALLPFAGDLTRFPAWPELKDLKTLFSQYGIDLTPVEQAEKPGCFEEHYEPRIFLKRELQTRSKNWHDLFNALVWFRFAQTKTVLNELHYHASLQRQQKSNRGALENVITLFDECGVVVISSRVELLNMIREHQWKSLFIDHRDAFERDIKCVVFGHAMYEKALSPYIGMTAQALLIHDKQLITGSVDMIDVSVANKWRNGEITSTRDLSPLPLLGIPGWFEANDNPAFYEYEEYFRPRRKK